MTGQSIERSATKFPAWNAISPRSVKRSTAPSTWTHIGCASILSTTALWYSIPNSKMFEGFISFDFTTQSEPPVSIHGIRGGSGPPLLLLTARSCPQTHHIWHRIAPQLIKDFTVIALDIRGYGASSKPSGVAQYSKTLMSRDCIVVLEELGFSSFFVCAHDRGARVAHKLLVNYPDRIRKAIFLDICPTLAMYSNTDFEFAKSVFPLVLPDPESTAAGNSDRTESKEMGRDVYGRSICGDGSFRYGCFRGVCEGSRKSGCSPTQCARTIGLVRAWIWTRRKNT